MLGANHIFKIGEARQFKIGVLIDIDEHHTSEDTVCVHYAMYLHMSRGL